VAAKSSNSEDDTSIGGTVLDVATKVLRSGLGLAPLLGGLFGLFGGDDKEEPAPLVKYAMPAPVRFEAAEAAGMMGSADYDQRGLPRVYREAGGPEPGAASAPQITVNVQAMDSRSFMDHSTEIAAAVREAMLNLNSINDVVTDL
jgi:hypothetical protein